MNLPDEFAGSPLGGARVVRLLRDLPQRRVMEIRLNGRAAYLKQFLQGDPSRAALAMQHRLSQAAAILGQARNAVALPLLVLPLLGAVVLEAASGQPLSDALLLAEPELRAALIARVGEWLLALAAPMRSDGQFGPRFWIDGLARRVDAADAPDRDLIAAHMRAMRLAARPLRGIRVDRAPLHGDLTPDNIFHDALTGRMTGIDLHGAGQMPVARDMARLLVWLESRRAVSPGPFHSGVDAADYDALTRVPGLLPPDQEPILHFMIGEIMLAYYLDARAPARRAALARAMRNWRYSAETSASAAS